MSELVSLCSLPSRLRFDVDVWFSSSKYSVTAHLSTTWVLAVRSAAQSVAYTLTVPPMAISTQFSQARAVSEMLLSPVVG